MRPLNIAVYYPWVYLKGGIERSMAALISRSKHNWTIFTSYYDRENTFEEFENLRVRTIGNVSVKRNMGAVLGSALKIVTLKLPLEGFDAYVVWCDGLGTLTTFRNSSIPTFCICSTPLRPVYDRVYAEEALLGRKRLAKLAYHSFKHVFRTIDRMAWRRFHGVVATSLEVKTRIVEHALYPDDSRMTLLHPGIDVSQAPSQVTYNPFFLVAGRISWTKNIQLAINAFLQANLPSPWRLVIAGFVDAKSQLYLTWLREQAQGNLQIEFVVSPSDEVLNGLYQSAYAVLFTPRNEDWGIAVLEGMLRAKPVLANASGGPAESIDHGETGWLLPPDATEWAKLLRTLPDRPAEIETMGANARRRVARYDWSRFVDGVDDQIYRTVQKTSPVGVETSAAIPTT